MISYQTHLKIKKARTCGGYKSFVSLDNSISVPSIFETFASLVDISAKSRSILLYLFEYQEGLTPLKYGLQYNAIYDEFKEQYIQYCVRIRDTNFPKKIPVVPYTCALSLIGADSIFWPKLGFA